MDPTTGIASVLQSYGAWGLSALLMTALVFMWRAYVEARNKQDVIHSEQLKAAIDLVEEVTRTGVEQRNAMNSVAEALRSIERRLENVEKRLG